MATSKIEWTDVVKKKAGNLLDGKRHQEWPERSVRDDA